MDLGLLGGIVLLIALIGYVACRQYEEVSEFNQKILLAIIIIFAIVGSVLVLGSFFVEGFSNLFS